MRYKPNFNDPRVINRLRHAYGFTKAVMSTEKSTSWSSRVIDKYYGRTNNKLGRYLRNTLLICTCHNYNKDNGIVKQYKINQYGLDYIRGILIGVKGNISPDISPTVQQVGNITDIDKIFDEQIVNEYCMREFGQQLRNLQFTYEDKSHRLWNPIQSIKKVYKKPLLAKYGLVYNYDIETCAPTLIYQYSIKCGNTEPITAILDYINNKNAIRERIANDLEVSTDIVKVIINALFNGAKIGSSPEFAISQLLGNDIARITWLKEDPYITQLRDEIKTCWKHIEPYTTTKYKNNRKLPMSSSTKWSVYFRLERQVLDSITNYLQQTNNKYFTEHDGFCTTNEVDMIDLSNHINLQLGYDVYFQLELQEDNSPDISPTVQHLL